MKDNPYELPPPSIVADLCAQRAWAMTRGCVWSLRPTRSGT
jgi:hypothetical protein